MDLEAEEAFEAAVLRVVVDHHGGDLTVEDMGKVVAASDDVELVPAVDVDVALELVAILELADDAGVLAGFGEGDLTAEGHDAAAAFFIEHAGVGVDEVHVGLIALEDPLADFGQLDAAVLDAAVGVVHAEFELELKVLGLAAAVDEEGVALERVFLGALADDGVVFDAPDLRVAVPVVEGAIEDGHKSGFVVDDDRVGEALTTATRLGRRGGGGSLSGERGGQKSGCGGESQCHCRYHMPRVSVGGGWHGSIGFVFYAASSWGAGWIGFVISFCSLRP